MRRDAVATLFAQGGALYAFVPSRSRPWGVYWDKAPELVRWFKTRRMADGFAQVNFRGSLFFVIRAHYPPVSHARIK